MQIELTDEAMYALRHAITTAERAMEVEVFELKRKLEEDNGLLVNLRLSLIKELNLRLEGLGLLKDELNEQLHFPVR